PVVAQRTMRFAYHGEWDGESTAVGADAPATSFYFAEGFTGAGFDEYLTMANPTQHPVDATVIYWFNDSTSQVQSITLPPHSRSTVDVRGVIGSGREVAATVSSAEPILVERPMYFLYRGVWSGGHVSAGLKAPSTHQSFAEGYTGPGFAEYLSIF